MTMFAALYRLAMRLTPADYRRRYGREALDVACRRVAARRAVKRPAAATRELFDLLRAADAGFASLFRRVSGRA